MTTKQRRGPSLSPGSETDVALVVPAPEDVIGDQLAEELAAVGLDTSVRVVGEDLVLNGLSEGDRETAEIVVRAHEPQASFGVDPDTARLRQLAAKPQLASAEVAEAVRLLLRGKRP